MNQEDMLKNRIEELQIMNNALRECLKIYKRCRHRSVNCFCTKEAINLLGDK